MANALANLFTDIADSIRSKTGSTEKLSPSEFASQIDNISVGGGGAEGCVTVTFMNGANVLLTRPVYIGDDCPDPVTQGRIGTPTKESTAQYNYTYSGWSEALTNITEDKVIYAIYTETVRTYTVNFYDGDTLLKTEQIAYGGSSTYTYEKENAIFSGWIPEPTNITSDLDCYGVWEKGISFATASWERIAEISESGKASEVFAIGDERTEKFGYYTVTLVIADFNYDLLADGSGNTAGMTIIMKDSHNFGFTSSYVRTVGVDWLSTTLYQKVQARYDGLSEELKAVIKPVQKKYRQENTSVEALLTSNEKLWIPSLGEVATSVSYGYDLLERSQDRRYALFENSTYLKGSYNWWTRSWKFNTTNYRAAYKKNGGWEDWNTDYIAYFRIGFCI